MTNEKLEFTHTLIIIGNFGLLAWLFLAFFGVVFYNIIYGWIFLVVAAALIYGILRRLGCNNCYQCKVCTSGFGRLAGAFFGKGLIKKGSVGNKIALVAVVYFLLLPLPAALLGLSMLYAFSVLKVLVLICLLAIGAFSLATWYKRSTVQSQS